MDAKIVQCVGMSLLLGFEPAQKTSLPVKLENITCDGGTAMRDAILVGTNMMLKIRQAHIEMELPNLWQFVHLIITDGEDNSSKQITKQGLQNLMSKIGNSIPPQLLKTMYIGVDLDDNDEAREELEELAEIGGDGAELKCISADEMGQLFQGIIFQLKQRIQIQTAFIQQNNQQMGFLQMQRTPEIHIQRQRYLILFTLDVSGSMEGQRWNKVTKAVRQILGSLGNDDMVCGIVFNNNCHVVQKLNTLSWNKEIYDRRQQEAAKKKAEEEAKKQQQLKQQQQQQQQQQLQQLREQQQRQMLVGLMLLDQQLSRLSVQEDSDNDDTSSHQPSSIKYQTNRDPSQSEACVIQ